jgi:hypothetical protein
MDVEQIENRFVDDQSVRIAMFCERFNHHRSPECWLLVHCITKKEKGNNPVVKPLLFLLGGRLGRGGFTFGDCAILVLRLPPCIAIIGERCDARSPRYHIAPKINVEYS